MLSEPLVPGNFSTELASATPQSTRSDTHCAEHIESVGHRRYVILTNTYGCAQAVINRSLDTVRHPLPSADFRWNNTSSRVISGTPTKRWLHRTVTVHQITDDDGDPRYRHICHFHGRRQLATRNHQVEAPRDKPAGSVSGQLISGPLIHRVPTANLERPYTTGGAVAAYK